MAQEHGRTRAEQDVLADLIEVLEERYPALPKSSQLRTLVSSMSSQLDTYGVDRWGEDWLGNHWLEQACESVDQLTGDGVSIVEAVDLVAEQYDHHVLTAELLATRHFARALERHGNTAPPQAEAA
jgi:hypothetical protein